MIKNFFDEIDENVKKLESRYLEMTELKRIAFITKIERLIQINQFIKNIINEIQYQKSIGEKAQKSIKNSILLFAFIIIAASTAPNFLGENKHYFMLVSIGLGLSMLGMLIYLVDDILTFFMSWGLIQKFRQNGNLLMVEFKLISGINYGPSG